jgi:hypothetical protein
MTLAARLRRQEIFCAHAAPKQHAFTEHAAFKHGDPAADLGGLDPRENLGRAETQRTVCDYSLDDD